MSDDAINSLLTDTYKAKRLSISPQNLNILDADEKLEQREGHEILIGGMLTSRKWLGDDECGRFFYEYDIGSGWQHAAQVIGRAPRSSYFKCLSGEGHPAAEDTHAESWEALKDAYRKPKKERDEEDEDTIDWYENGGCVNGDRRGLGGKGAERWSIKAVNKELKRALKPMYGLSSLLPRIVP